jgi:hypothetical protein
LTAKGVAWLNRDNTEARRIENNMGAFDTPPARLAAL